MKAKIYIGLATIFLMAACQKKGDNVINGGDNSNNNDQNPNSGWLIPQYEVFDGGPGKDGIPALENPTFVNANQVSYLNNDELVLGYVYGGEARAYPHAILNWHEIINDDIQDLSLAIIYCPLTGTGIGWSRQLVEGKTTFGVSGLIYNSNIIPYDRLTGSNWSQMLLKSVHGEKAGTLSTNYNLIETTWATWKLMYPNTKIVSGNTGYGRNYSASPYGDYFTNHNTLLFPITHNDSRLPNKERVLGILSGSSVKAYSIEGFSDTISIISDLFNNEELVITGSKKRNFIVAYNSELNDGTMLTFKAVQNSLPIIMEDHEGSRWDVFGKAISGPRMGQQLKSVTQFMGFWFAWATFYPGIELQWYPGMPLNEDEN